MNADGTEDGLRDRCVDDPLWAADEIVRLRAANERTLARLYAEADEAGTYGRRDGLLRAVAIIRACHVKVLPDELATTTPKETK